MSRKRIVMRKPGAVNGIACASGAGLRPPWSGGRRLGGVSFARCGRHRASGLNAALPAFCAVHLMAAGIAELIPGGAEAN